MQIVFATAGGPLGLESLRALAGRHRIVAVVRPRPGGAWWRRTARRTRDMLRGRSRDIVSDWTRQAGIPVLTASSGGDTRLADALRRAAPDFVCIAGFPWLFRPELLAAPRVATLNLHPSLLPRHRGPNPFFWTYYHDDRETGVTVHVASERADAGPIVAQWRTPLPRGLPVEQLYLSLAEQGARLFESAVQGWSGDPARLRPQDETKASSAPRVPDGRAMVDFTWDVERVWHFLAGLVPRFREPLRDRRGWPVRYGGVAGYDRCDPAGPPGTVAPQAMGWTLWCRDGAVHLTRRSA
jgi:methionyl-tRNA formyltransferase